MLFRLSALREVDGYSDDLIAGEEPDLCLRLGLRGWTIRRIDAEMTLHDAAIMTARQWWLRTRRAGHAFAEHCARHGAHAFASWRAERNRIALWGIGLPLLFVALSIVALVTCSCLVAIAAAAVAALFPCSLPGSPCAIWAKAGPSALLPRTVSGWWQVVLRRLVVWRATGSTAHAAAATA